MARSRSHDPKLSLWKAVERLEHRTLLSATLAGEDAVLPRYLTAAEKEWIAQNPEIVQEVRLPSAPPTGPIDPVAEYEPMEGLVISWLGGTSLTNILAQITRRVTVDGNGRVYIGVTSASAQNTATSTLTSVGANLANVTFYTAPLNSIWARDYGPRYVYEGDVRVITDHRYNRPTRPSDDNQPVVFGQLKRQQYYEIGLGSTTLVHGGGNYHLDGNGDAYATQLIVNENPSLSAAQIQQIWDTYQSNDVTITQPFPPSVDATQHIDMWMQIYDDNKVFISDWPNNPGSTQDQICDNTAALMQSRGYQVTRIPAYSIGGTHYTFANMVIFNNIVLLPQYNNGPGATVSSQALATVQAAFGPGKTVFALNADSIVGLAGVFHCIVQHIPKHLGQPGSNGGLAPTAYLRGPNGGETLLAGQQYEIKWLTDDDAPVAATGGVQEVEIQLSLDGGQTFPMTIASGQPALGSFLWTVPADTYSAEARIRVVARDAAGNTGGDGSDASFTLGTPPSLPVEQPNLDSASDSGASDTDNLTNRNNATPSAALAFEIGGTSPGALVEVFANGVLVGSAVAAAAVTQVVTDGVTALADGGYVITARQTQPGLPPSPLSAVLSVTIDTVAPEVRSSEFLFETFQRIDLGISETLGPDLPVALTNLTAGTPAKVTVTEISPAEYHLLPQGGGWTDGNYRLTYPLQDLAGNSAAEAGILEFFVLAGDADRNRTVDIDDFGTLAMRFNLSGTFSQGDFDYSGTADIDDFSVLAINFNTVLSPLGGRPRLDGHPEIPAGPAGLKWSDAYRRRERTISQIELA